MLEEGENRLESKISPNTLGSNRQELSRSDAFLHLPKISKCLRDFPLLKMLACSILIWSKIQEFCIVHSARRLVLDSRSDFHKAGSRDLSAPNPVVKHPDSRPVVFG